jgi:nucleoid-associated protein YgaU
VPAPRVRRASPRYAADSAPRKTAARRAGAKPASATQEAPRAASRPHGEPAAAPASRPAVGRAGLFEPLRAAPFLVAVILSLGLTILSLGATLPARAPSAAAAPASVAPAPAASAPTASVAPAPAASVAAAPPETTNYVVQRGDTLWKIFKSRGEDPSAWKGFLSSMQAANDLPDPDLIRPGKVLSLSAQGK